jgi:hypothetical protein
LVIEFITIITFQMLQRFAYWSVCRPSHMCKWNYVLTPELLGVKYQDTCRSTKCFEVSDATILI